jgi:hypothetical protein
MAPESMETLMQGTLKEELNKEQKRNENQLMKAALKLVQINLWKGPRLPTPLPQSSNLAENKKETQSHCRRTIPNCPLPKN